MSNQSVFLIDAHGLCYRAFYAVKALANSKGQPTNAVLGFCNILRKLLKDCHPTHIAVCFDVGKKTHRQTKYADYKIQRQAMPDDLVRQIMIIRQVIEAYRFPIFELEGYEADDVMATIAKRLAGKGVDVFIATDDKDMCQLVDTHVKVYSPRQEKIIDTSDVVEKFGVNPLQITDYIALAGDSSDNIPGVEGIGDVTACKLLEQFSSIDEIYRHIDEIKPLKAQEKLIAGKEKAYLSKELAILDHFVPLDISLDSLIVQEPDREKLYALFNELEFRKFALEYAQGEAQIEFSGELKTWVKVNEGGKNIHIVYDLKSLRKTGQFSNEDLKDKVFDVYLADYLLAGGGGKYHMPSLRATDQGMEELYHIQKELMKEQQVESLFYDVEMPLNVVLFHMEKNGVQLDVEILKELSVECQNKITEMIGALYKNAGEEFNLNSPKQLSKILFEKLKLPVVKKTKTGFSTDEEVLSKLASKHPLPALILEYRQIAKLKSTYIDALPALVDQDNRLHASFNQTGAETGRLSSNNPNLQNIPVRTDFGKRIRKAFVPYSKGDVLLSADYSQIEIRILAHLADDWNLKEAFKGTGDIHRYTASLMFEVPEDKVDESMRYAAKRINFGIIYGMSSFGLAKDLDVSIAQAQDFIDKYFLRYPKVHGFLDGQVQKARDLGYVTTLFNRRRYLPDINNRNMALRQFAERQAINAPMQGTAADLIKLAMVNVSCRMIKEKLSSIMIMTVHDELVFNVPQEEVDIMVDLVRHEMENAMKLDVPLLASVKVGLNWLEMPAIDGAAQSKGVKL
ncbi:MAG: DNA polymerase I [Candidatus Omnitrophota bacterium]